jgi:muramidase (phage lysozyme)
MVDLLLLPDRIVTSTAPQSSVSRQDVAAPYNEMAGALGKVADTMMDVATKQAKEQAADDLQQQKVVRNDDGSVSVVNPANSMIFGRAGETYHAAVVAGTIAQHGNVISQQLNELHQEYPTDPAAFEKAAAAYRAKYLADHGGGVTGQGIAQHFDSLQTQHYNAITNTAGQLDVTNQQKSLMAQIADNKNTLQGLARQPGGTDTPQFKQSLEMLQASYKALGTNPLFKMPQEQIDLEVKNFKGLLQGEAIVAHIDETFTKKGKGDAQKALNESILQNPDLSEVDRNRLYSHGMARLQYLTADALERVAAGKEDVTLLKDNLASGKVVPTDPLVGMAMAQAMSRGDAKGAHEIYANQLVAQQRRGLDTLPLEMQAQALGINRLGAVNQAIPPEGRALLDHIAGPESAGLYNVRYGGKLFAGFADHPRVDEPITSGPDAGKTSSAAGRYQFLGSTWDAQKKKLGLKDFSPENQDAAAWDLAQTEYKAKTGKDLLGVLKSGDQAAISDVPRQLSGQWSSLPGGRQPAGSGRGIAPAANGGAGFTYEQVQRNPYLISAAVRAIAADETSSVQAARLVIGGVGKAVDAGLAPDPADVALARQQAARYPEKLGAEVAAMDGRINSEIVSKLPAPERAALTAQYREMSDGQDQHHMRVAAAFFDQQQASEKRLAEKPFEEAAHRGWIAPVAPIDPGKPETIPAALTQRIAASQRIAAMNHSPAPPVLAKDEVPQLQAALEGPAGAQVLAQVATTLRAEDMEKLLGQKGFTDTLTAMQSSLDPVKMSTANAVVDKQWQQNAARAEQALGKSSIDKMQAWNALKGSFGATELAKLLNQSDDPATAKAREQAVEAAKKEVKTVSPSDMAYKMGTGSWLLGGITGNTPRVPFDALTGSALVNDYSATYTQLRTMGLPADKASDAAVKRLASTWGPSEAAGNQLMRLPPEHYNRPIEGAPNWIGEQLTDFVTASQGPAMRKHPDVPGKGSSPRTSWSIAGLVSDSRTEGEISGGRPPSYFVAIKRGNGDIDVLPDRITFDSAKYMAKHEAALRGKLTGVEAVRTGNTGMPQP